MAKPPRTGIIKLWAEQKRIQAKMRGRASTIRVLLGMISEATEWINKLVHDRENARRWIRGEFTPIEEGQEKPTPWSCLWCGEMLEGGRADAKEHVLQCQENPLVKEVSRLKALHAEMVKELYGQRFQVAGFHMNGDLSPLDNWFEGNGWVDVDTWQPG